MTRPTFVYFVAPAMGGPIKIGCSWHPVDRLESLMAWAPYPLQILAHAPGSFDDERTIHGVFAEHWSHSEWFRPHPDIYALINLVRATGEIPEAYRAGEDRPRGVPNPRRRRTPEQREKQSRAQKARWAEEKSDKAGLKAAREFITRTQISAAEFDKAVKCPGAHRQIMNYGYIGHYREDVLAFIAECDAKASAA